MSILTEQQVQAFKEDGFLIVPRLFDTDQISVLKTVARADRERVENAWGVTDIKGGRSKIWLQNDLHDDVYSAFVRSDTLVNSMEQLLDGEVYHYHHKMTMKEPFIAGAWEWHQDYGYWYNNACLFPYMASCMIAVDACTLNNGCMQVLKGSHHMGRLNHGQVAGQTGADMERVNQAMKRLELVHAVMEPGDGLFFHCNVLHYSGPNESPDPRWTLICCYNAARNNPYRETGHPSYSFLEKWPDSKIVEIGARQAAGVLTAASR